MTFITRRMSFKQRQFFVIFLLTSTSVLMSITFIAFLWIQNIHNIEAIILFTESIILIFAFWGARLTTAVLSEPIERIVSATQALSNGEFIKRIEVKGNDEIADLARAFNIMADKIQDNHEHLEELVQRRTQQLMDSNIRLEQEIAERLTNELALHDNEKLLRRFFEALPDRAVILDAEGRYHDVLKADQNTLIPHPENVIGKTLHEVFNPGFADFCYAIVQKTLQANQLQIVEYTMQEHDIDSQTGNLAQIEGRIVPFKDPTTDEARVLWIARDITAQKRAEQSLVRRNRAFRLLSECTRAVIHTHEETELYTDICNTIVNSGYSAAWVGVKQYDSAYTILPIAQAGLNEAQLKLCKFTWADQEPIRIAFQTALPGVSNDLRENSYCEALVKANSGKKLLSWVVLPLVIEDDIIAILNIYADETNAFTLGELSLLMDMSNEIAYGLRMLRIRREQIRSEQNLTKYSERLQTLTQQLMIAQEQERQRISRELHDGIGQALTALKISLNIAANTIPQELEQLRQRVNDLVQLADSTLEQVHVVAQDLRPAALDTIGLIPTMQSYCKEFSQRTNLTVEFHQINTIPGLSDVASTALYRVMQEALTNVAKHADAQHAIVTIDFDVDTVHLIISDDGHGINQEHALDDNMATGIGILGIIERIELLDGTFNIQSILNKGTRIMVSIPYREEK